MPEKSKRWVAVLRTLHQSRKLNKVSEGAELLYRRLLEVVDDNGNYDADPALILGQALARRMAQGLTVKTTGDRLKELVKEELVWLYRGDELLHISNHYTKLRADGHGAIVLYDSPTPEELALPRTPNGDQEVTKGVPQTRLDQTRQDKTRESPQPSADGRALAEYLQYELTRTLPNIPSSKQTGAALEKRLAAWGLEFDRYGRLDGVTDTEYRGIITFALANDFWRSNVGSPGALRTMKHGKSAKVWVDFRKAGPKPPRPPGQSADDVAQRRCRDGVDSEDEMCIRGKPYCRTCPRNRYSPGPARRTGLTPVPKGGGLRPLAELLPEGKARDA